jgi:nitroreductase
VEVGAAIRARRTHKQYGSEPVSEEVVRTLCDLARWAPNHQLTSPWRFRLLGPETRAAVDAAVGEKDAAKLRRAPTLVVVSAVLSDDPVLAEEDMHATACAVYALLLGATDRGLASYWRSPACFRDHRVHALLDFAENERFVGLVHLGPRVSDPPAKGRAPLDDVFTSLP